MDLAEQVITSVTPHPAVRSVRLVGSRAEGRVHELSDWDFRVDAHDFDVLAPAVPELLAGLQPVAQQWDRLSTEWCWMLILHGPVKVDLIFADEPHTDEPRWEPNRENLDAIDAHFWDWTLWLRGKEAGGKAELVTSELDKLFHHLLAPLGVKRPPTSIKDAIWSYRKGREHAENEFGVVVGRDVESAVAPAFKP